MHHSLRQRLLPPLIAAAIVALVAPLATPTVARADDGAGVGVARLSVVDGNVAIARGDSNTTVAAVVNAPLLGADYLTTGDGARAEVQFDGRTALRVGGDAQLRLSHIDNGSRAIQLASGTVDLRLLRGTDGSTSIDTPSISVVPRETGSYRVSVDENGTTFVTVRSGSADVELPAGPQRIDPGSTLVADGAASNPHIDYRDAIGYDDFDAFNRNRDRVAQDTVADNPYVNGDIDGVGDLNAYGRWVDDGSYGHVWTPSNVAAGWAPYRTGNWVWEDGYGWTWVAAEPWGWAPYHYGRWYFSSAYHSWCWYPPARAAVIPAWSPALVGFVGFSIGAVSVGIGFGHIGWVPLAPYEPLHPWWGSHATVVNNVTYNNVNVYNNTTVNRTVYRNLQNNGMTGVSVENFRAGRFNEASAVTREQFAAARPIAVQGALPVVPTANNLRFTQREAAAAPTAVRTGAFAGRPFAGTATVAQRTPFAEQQTNVARVTHAPLEAPAAARAPQFARPEVQAPSYARPQTERNLQTERANDPWSRFNAGRGPGVTPQGAPPAQQRAMQTERPSYAAPAAADRAPQVDRPSYQRPQSQAPAPQYQRQAPAPQYQRPQYQAPAAQYQRQAPAPPQYQRPQAQPRPQVQAPQRSASAPRDAGNARGDAPRAERRERG